MQIKQAKILKTLLSGLVLLLLTGCLPEDTFLAIRFSPDGQLLAVVSEKLGLLVADPAGMETLELAPGHIDPANVAWTSNSLALAYASNNSGTLDIYMSSLDKVTTRITSSPARETNPMIRNGRLYYLTSESGQSQLTSQTINKNVVHIPAALPTVDWEVLTPKLSPDGEKIAAYGFIDMRPQIFSFNLFAGKVDQLTTETDPFSLVLGTLTWGADSNMIGFLRGEVLEKPIEDDDNNVEPDLPSDGRGKYFNARYLDTPGRELKLVRSPEGIRGARFEQDGSAVFASGRNLVFAPPSGNDRVMPLDLSSAMPETGGDDGEIAFVAAGQLIGLTSASLQGSRILTFDLKDRFLLAEEYFRSGNPTKSYELYEELAASVKRTRDPKLARFVYIANLRRLGKTAKAVVEIEKMLAEKQQPDSVPEKYLWRLLGFSYLLELDDLPKSARSFEKYRELTSATIEADSIPDSAINALKIVENAPSAVTKLYARAVKARLDGNFQLTDQLFGDLLTTASTLLPVQREYLNALDGFDKEVYYFSPTQRPFSPSRSQRADYLQRFVDHVTSSTPSAKNAHLELFLLRIEMGSYSRARTLLTEALATAPTDARPDGILEVFQNYLETPEPQPWINQAMPEVFLFPAIRKRLESFITDPQDRLLMAVAATKVAIVQNQPDAARTEANAAALEWNRIPKSEQSADVAAMYGRLLVFRAREAELRGLYSEAAERYDQAVALLAEMEVDNFEFQEEIRYRAALMRMLIKDFPDITPKMSNVELRTGVELVNPSWDTESLEGAVHDYLAIYDTTSNTLKLWTAYENGILFSKLNRPAQARSALLLAASDSAPGFLQRKAFLELAATDEYMDDPWNAAGWYSKLAALPGLPQDMRMWCSFQIARLHLSINYKTQAAREALAVIVSNRPDAPLTVQAQQLLISTSTR